MKFTPGVVLDAPSYYVDHFDGKYNVDKCTVLRDLDLESDSDMMPSCIALLTRPTNVLDFTNNNLLELPDLKNRSDIHTLLFGRNRINDRVDGKKLPKNLKNLVLTSNNIKELQDLNDLKRAPKTLRNLSLLGNPICHLEGYRGYILNLLPQLNTLDFTKVSDQEKIEIKKKPIQLLDNKKSKMTNNKDEKEDKSVEMMNFVLGKMTEERRNELKKQLTEVSSLEEIMRIEKLLSGGL